MRLALALLCCWAAAFAQGAGKANAHYQTEEGRRQMAEALTSPDRDRTERPRDLVAGLGIRPGATVADIGTGPGYMVPYLARAVGPRGRVLAEDIFPDFLKQAADRASQAHLANVTTVLGTEDDPKLPAGEVDMAFSLEVYHHLEHPERVLANIGRSLRPGGRLVIVDFYRRREAMPGGDALEHIRADQAQVIREVEAAGFRLERKHDHIPGSQYVLVFSHEGPRVSR